MLTSKAKTVFFSVFKKKIEFLKPLARVFKVHVMNFRSWKTKTANKNTNNHNYFTLLLHKNACVFKYMRLFIFYLMEDRIVLVGVTWEIFYPWQCCVRHGRGVIQTRLHGNWKLEDTRLLADPN